MSTVQGGQGNIVTNGLVLNLDAANPRSYPQPYNGTTWQNIAPVSSSLTGSLVNGVAYTGSNGGALVFDGVNDYVNLGDVLNLGTNSMTINAWVKVNTSPTLKSILTKTRAAAQNYRFQFRITSNNQLSAFIYGNSGVDVITFSNEVLTDNVWYMCTVIFDRASTIRFYLNSQLLTNNGSNIISQWDGLDFQSNNPLRIGASTASDNISTNGLFSGNISQIQVYFKTLTPSEILQNFNATRARFGI
jgi:hypothetical protein